MKRRVSRYTSDFIRTTMAMAIWSWERVTSRITSASSLSIHQWLYLLRGRFTDLTNCATISLSLSLSLARSTTFNLNPNRKSNAIFTIVSPFSQPLLCFSFFFFFSKFEILFLPPPFSFEFFSFRMYLVFFFFFFFFLLISFFYLNFLETIQIPSVMLELQKPGQSATTSEAPGIAARYDSANTTTTKAASRV